ncbi:MAG: FIST C-terminal domain-containing protein, partial [Candidatus Omnitrophica bacterium]|nr:FIST C-terminal domain-containing protein [Candidatus Omnitrophota bacterium]
GWSPIGKPRKVTQSYLNRVNELDGTPASNLYAEYFGGAAEELKRESLARLTLAYPLGMSVPGEEEYLLRNVLRVDAATGALIYSADIPQQSYVRLMMGSSDTILSAARKAASQAMSGLNGKKPLLAFVFNSVARKKLLRFQAREEIAAIQETVGPETPIAGFYSYGEQAPLRAAIHRGESHFHNESVVVVTISEN